MKRSAKRVTRVIYIEMIVLSLLLVAAVIIAFRINKSDSTDYRPQANSNQTVDTTPTDTTPTDTTPAPGWKPIPEGMTLTSEACFVYNRTTQSFLVSTGSEDTRVAPGNITKLFTAYVICKTMILNPDGYCWVDEGALALVKPGDTVSNLKPGDKLTARKLMEAMLICNGDDATYILASAAGRQFANNVSLTATEAIEAFVDKMNSIAQEEGMMGTNFTNPNGASDPNQYMTFRDMITLANICDIYPVSIKHPAVVPSADIKLHNETVIWENNNKLIDPNSPYYNTFATGLKAGSTSELGSSLLSTFYKDKENLVIGVFNSPTADNLFTDVTQLFNYTVSS